MPESGHPQKETLFGHPVGLFTLFFAEMWERFSYYGMRALLLFYMLKGFLHYGDQRAYTVYGSYTALVYMTPFFGGMLADRLLGQRRAVVFGGLLMAAGHLLMTVQTDTAFFFALALLIAGNGFFKPNISTIVGSLYPDGSKLRDGGFTLFYMGVNLGAALSPLLCGYIGETYGWHYGFGLATIGMLSGLMTFVVPTRTAQALIVGCALSAAAALVVLRPDNPLSFGVNLLVGAALLAAATTSAVALGRGGLPKDAGAPPDPGRLRERLGPVSREWVVYLAALASLPIFALLVSGFATFTRDHGPVTLLSHDIVVALERSKNGLLQILAVVAAQVSKPAGLVLTVTGGFSLAYLG
ncbi:MAG TPA: peptide MFS transporter, partial [Polyangiaceae bacterium]|nr:peptide MFS transporter [Polyangiaceae bacterium]